MGLYVHDGILLGTIIEGSKLPREFPQDDIIQYLENTIKIHKEPDAKAICWPNSDNVPSPYYIGIFWTWSERHIMSLDEKWFPLFLPMPQSESDQMFNNGKNRLLQQRIFENLTSYFSDLSLEDIKFFEARYIA